MDSEGVEMQQQMDDTMADLTDKLEDLGDQASGTVKTVKESINTVRDAFDVKFQVRRHPLAALAGATALGLFLGFRTDGKPTRASSKNSGEPVAQGAPSERPCAGANGNTNGADAGHAPAAAAPSFWANLGETFNPEICALRGAAVDTLLQVVREAIRDK